MLVQGKSECAEISILFNDDEVLAARSGRLLHEGFRVRRAVRMVVYARRSVLHGRRAVLVPEDFFLELPASSCCVDEWSLHQPAKCKEYK